MHYSATVDNAAPLTDPRELFTQIARGDSHALGLLYDRYGARLYTLALRITRSPKLAEDVVKEVFAQCWDAASRFLEGDVAAELIAVTRQQAYRATGATRGLTAHNPLLAVLAGYCLTHDDTTALHVHAALASLPDEQRQMIELAYYEGLAQSEIAAQLKLPPGAVARSLRSGMLALCARLRATAEAAAEPSDM